MMFNKCKMNKIKIVKKDNIVDLSSISQMKQSFHNVCEHNRAANISIKDHLNCRIATYNIHYWTDLNDNPSFDRIFDDIKAIDADILCLQEVSFDITKYNHYTHNQLID